MIPHAPSCGSSGRALFFLTLLCPFSVICDESHAATLDTLVVNVSEDAYLGDALFTVSVDKKKIGGNLTATALHAKGASQDFTLTGAWGPGPHVVTVRFLVDAYGGSAGKDRNLYVNSVTLDGRSSTAPAVEIARAGGMDFPVPAETAPPVPTPTPTPAPVPAAVFAPGVNLSGMEDNSSKKPGKAGTDYAVIKPSEITYYAGKGFRLLRLPVLWERLQPNLLAAQPDTTPDPAYLKLVTDVLTEADASGMGVIVDLHNFGNYNGIKFGATGSLTPAQFGDAWTVLASVLKGYHGLIGYDLMNEPNGFSTSSTWQSYAQAGIGGVRVADPNTTIFVEGDAYASAAGWPKASSSLNTLVDSSNKLVFEAHVYGDRDSSGTHFTWNIETANGVTVNTIAQRVDAFGGWCKTNRVTCTVGEVGVGNDSPNWNTQLANGLAEMKAQGLVSATYWAGGPWWGSNYPMSVEPLNGQDRAQLPVLQAFIQ